MSDLHYKKDGSLDMRYSSSKAAVGSSSLSFGSSASSGSFGSSYLSRPTENSSYSDLHYKKDGSLDMRYSSSKAAVGSSSLSRPIGNSSYSDLHYKKDGTPDMRYSSSKAAVGSSSLSRPIGNSSYSDLHYKKDGTPDMRYSSSKAAVGSSSLSRQTGNTSYSDLHYKKDGTPDMRYKSSKAAVKNELRGIIKQTSYLDLDDSPPNRGKSLQSKYHDIPTFIKIKADGTPDMRTRAAQDWVQQQASSCGDGFVPDWVPRNKDGSIKSNTAIGRIFLKSCKTIPLPSALREQYWCNRLQDELFATVLESARQTPVEIPENLPLLHTDPIPKFTAGKSQFNEEGVDTFASLSMAENVHQINWDALKFDKDDETPLGRGAFGVVLKASWNGKYVAVKKLHLDRLTKKDKDSFQKELYIFGHLAKHPNLVQLYGYCLDPPCIVMEFVKLGSLTDLLHYCDDPEIEVMMSNGKIKKRLMIGVANGMNQLHALQIVHGDLKPQNILVTELYEAKITDFGLSTLRGKTSSSLRSEQLDDESGEMGGGTSGYMAPELLESTSPPEFQTDVYSFGIVLNEVVTEEEPYSDQYKHFSGRGVFGAALYAKQGKRPTMDTTKISGSGSELIKRCWASDPRSRPTFKDILVVMSDPKFEIKGFI